MADPQEIERDLKEYLEKEPNIRRGDRITYLMGIVNKHFGRDKIDHMLTKDDLNYLVSVAKSNFVQQSGSLNISSKAVEKGELPSLAMIEAVISYLNKNALLKKLVKVDYTNTVYDSND